jgi:predicted nuclease with RNAse H fold
MVETVHTLGIDLAAQAKQTAACLLMWGEGQAAIERLALGVDDAAILELIRSEEPAKVAIDAPFGWPAPFVAAVSQHASGGEWHAHAPQSLRLRATDLHVIAKTRQQPLSVSADKIAVTAFRCAGLLNELTKAGFAIDRAGDGLVVEVYPAAALRQWRMDPRGYKGDKPEARIRRAELVGSLADRMSAFLALDEEQRALIAASDHLLDALLCALVGRAALIEATLSIPAELRELASVEGWIALPRSDSLSELPFATTAAARERHRVDNCHRSALD